MFLDYILYIIHSTQPTKNFLLLYLLHFIDLKIVYNSLIFP